MDSPNYFHGYSPLTIRWALDAHAGLKSVWAFMAGSPLVYPDKWEPYRAVLHSPGSFTLGISTALGKTGASRVMHAFFGEGEQDGAVTLGDEQPWELSTHPPGCGTAWKPASLAMWGGFAWPGTEAGNPWPEPPGLWAPWGDPGLSGLPRPQPRSTDPLEKLIPPPLAMSVEEAGILGWVAPLGVPSASLPKRMS
jgi:hypothetical protein